MNSLKSYGSDEESATNKERSKISKMNNNRLADLGTNYDDVGMDISEDEDLDGAGKGMSSSSSQGSEHRSNRKSSTSEENKDRHKQEPPPRSSVQERLMDLASGSSSEKSRKSSQDDKDDRHSHRRQRSRSRSRDRGKRRSPDRHGDRRPRHRGRRSRSRSRDRRRSRSRDRRSRSRDRRTRSRSRERRRRSRSRSRERKRPIDLRKEAQQKLAQLKASNPELTGAELMKRSMEAQAAEVQKQTGIAIPSYYNPATINPTRFAEQERKKKLLWGNKDKNVTATESEAKPQSFNFVSAAASQAPKPNLVPSLGAGPAGPLGTGQAALWANTKFNNDNDGKMAEKFRRLMGVKSGNSEPTPPVAPKQVKADPMQRQENMFHNMEKQYEVARLATHTQRGFGLGFSSQPYIPK